MPRFVVDGDGDNDIELEADNWMTALGEGMTRFGLTDRGLNCDVTPTGDIVVDAGDKRFVIREVRGPAQAKVEARRLDDALPQAPPSPFDAPDPSETRAWEAREDEAEAQLAELETRVAAVDHSETAEDACNLALDLLLAYVPAEAGAVLLADRRNGDLCFTAARGPRARGLVGVVVPAGKGIAGLAARSSVPVTVREAKSDPRLYREVEKKSGYATDALMCVPIRGGGTTLGCVELLNPFADADFEAWHQAAAQIVASRLAQRLD
jgi:hypothetical protein